MTTDKNLGNTSIALLCPTRGRPEQFKRMEASFRRTTADSHGHGLFPCVSKEDLPVYDGSPYSYEQYIVLPDNMPTAHKWNYLAEFAKVSPRYKFFMLCSDDVVFQTPCWDQALIDHYNSLENKIHVYHLRDGRTGHGTPHPIVTREYIEAMGYFMPPLFMHWFVDTWTVEIAKAAGCFTHLNDYMLDHIKPSDEGKPDETHSRIRQWGWHDRDQWVNKYCQHFLDFEKRRLITHFVKSAKVVA